MDDHQHHRPVPLCDDGKSSRPTVYDCGCQKEGVAPDSAVEDSKLVVAYCY